MAFGFFIKKLSVQGLNAAPAEISFSKGANVITGLSDTGKSYIFSTLSYALGKGEEPKNIVESIGYNEVYLEIESFKDSITYTIFRSLQNKSKVEVKECALQGFKTSNAPRKIYNSLGSIESEDSYQGFLLTLANLSNKKLLSNKAKGLSKTLSFRDIVGLTFIAEDKIITEASPFYYSTQFTQRIAEQSLLHLILTGNDFATVQKNEDVEQKEIQIRGKLEFISYQIAQHSAQRDKILTQYAMEQSESPDTELIESLDNEVRLNIERAKQITDNKNILIANIEKIQKEINYKDELTYRFSLLQKQYNSDLKRLEFILEGDTLSAQLGDAICPICASQLDENHFSHVKELKNFKESVREEIRNTKAKVIDLSEAMLRLDEEKKIVDAQKRVFDIEIATLESELRENFSPKIKELKADLRALMAIENTKNHITFIDDQVKTLFTEKDRLENIVNSKDEQDEVNLLSYSILAELSEKIENRLSKWNFEPMVNVVFDSAYRVFDIVISGKSRRSYGKGRRAVSYSACLLGLLDYCLEKEMSFSNLVVMDSPLTTYKGKEGQSQEDKLEDVHEIDFSFFQDLAATPKICQIIIFDNKIPDVSLQNLLHTTIFTKDKNTGRAGFFPN